MGGGPEGKGWGRVFQDPRTKNDTNRRIVTVITGVGLRSTVPFTADTSLSPTAYYLPDIYIPFNYLLNH